MGKQKHCEVRTSLFSWYFFLNGLLLLFAAVFVVAIAAFTSLNESLMGIVMITWLLQLD